MRQTYVVDASVAVKWFLPEDGADEADALVRGGTLLLAPSIVLTELANAFWKICRRGALSTGTATSMLRDAPRYFHELIDSGDALHRAFAIAVEHDHPVYDCLYVAVAEQRGAKVVTADKRLLAKFSGTVLDAYLLALTDVPG